MKMKENAKKECVSKRSKQIDEVEVRIEKREGVGGSNTSTDSSKRRKRKENEIEKIKELSKKISRTRI